ncbi:MAG: PIN domain-containing protein [Deltaproteobacteria bacterium]|nr:PIN domain-containing protein [Deltaproteobacteria bacterium]
MKTSLVDTNVIIRYLVEDPDKVQGKFKGVFTFFPKVERGETKIEVCELVLFEAFFVLTKLYDVPQKEAADKLSGIISFKGVIMPNKGVILSCLEMLQAERIDLVDAYLLAFSKKKNIKGIYSFDRDLSKRGLDALDIA